MNSKAPCNGFVSVTETAACAYYRSQTKFAKVMFLHVSVCPQGGERGVPALGRYTPPGRYTPRHSVCWDTVNKRAVRIPLDLIIFTVRFRFCLHVPSMLPFFVPFRKCIEYSPMVLFTPDVKKIKGAAHTKKRDIDVTCKQALKRTVKTFFLTFTQVQCIKKLSFGRNTSK